MAKCGGCGKFMSTSEGVRCAKCPGGFHHACVGLPVTAKVSPNWVCPGCKAKTPRSDNSSTPVKCVSSDCSTNTTTTVTSDPDPLKVLTSTGPAESETTSSSIAAVSNKPAGLNLAYEIRCMREELGAIRDELRDFKKEVLDLKASFSSCNERVNAVENRVADLEGRFENQSPERYDQLEATIVELKTQLNERDQDLLQNDVIITGIPETQDETPVHLLKLISAKLGVTIDDRDIVNIERIGMVRRNITEAVPRPRVIAARLARRATRDQLLRAARVRRGLTTTDFGLRGQSQKFYLNERLTPANSKLFFSAREAGIRYKYKYVWTKDGRIYAKKDDSSSALRIRCEADLARIFGNTSV